MATLCMVVKNSFWSLEDSLSEALSDPTEIRPELLRCRSRSDSFHVYGQCSYDKSALAEAASDGETTIDNLSEEDSPLLSFSNPKLADDDDDNELVCIDDDSDDHNDVDPQVASLSGPPGAWTIPSQMHVGVVFMDMKWHEEQWMNSLVWLHHWQGALSADGSERKGRGRRGTRGGKRKRQSFESGIPQAAPEARACQFADLRVLVSWADCSDDE